MMEADFVPQQGKGREKELFPVGLSAVGASFSSSKGYGYRQVLRKSIAEFLDVLQRGFVRE